MLDAFHVVKLGTRVVDEVRRRVQQLHRRGHKDDPLFKLRGLLRHGLDHLSERQHRKLQICQALGEVELAWARCQQLPAVYNATASVRERRALAEKLITSFPSRPVPEVARLGRTLRAWRAQVLA